MLYPFLTGFTKPESAVNTRAPSLRLWGRMKLNEMLEQGVVLYDDFYFGGGTLANNAVKWDGPHAIKYHFFGTSDANGASSCAVVAVATNEYPIGQLALTVNYDEHEGYLSFDSAVSDGTVVLQKDLARVAFEARVRFNHVSGGSEALEKIVGLATPGQAATGTIGATEIESAPFVGFRALASAPNSMDAVYASATGVVVHRTAAQDVNLTLSADTYVKLGLYFDGKKCYWFVNGQQIGAGVLPNAQHFPAGAPLVPLIGIKGEGTASGKTAVVDWLVLGAYAL